MKSIVCVGVHGNSTTKARLYLVAWPGMCVLRTVDDMLRFGQAWLATLAGDGLWGIDEAQSQQVLQSQSPSGQLGVGLGWICTDDLMPTSALTAITAYTGFTGSLEAIVPPRQLVWALLRNRTRPNAPLNGIIKGRGW